MRFVSAAACSLSITVAACAHTPLAPAGDFHQHLFGPGTQQISPDLPRVEAQSDRESFVRWAKANAKPIATVEPREDDSDLAPLKRIVGAAHIAAFGESAHGMHESLAFRNRLFEYLVQHLGFTAIALEAGLAESRRANDYVGGGSGSVADAAHAFTWGPAPAENIELVRWIRTYNANPAHDRKVHVYGIDMELIGVPGDTTPRHAALDESLAYLARVDSGGERHTRAALAPYIGRLSVAKYQSLSAAENDALSAAIDDLIALLERERIAYLARAPEAAYEWAYRNALVARQTNEMVRVLPPASPDGIPPGGWRATTARDAAMAENVRWIVEREGKQGRVFVFAHDAHVKNAPTEGSVWSAFDRPPNAMGQFLRSKFGDSIVIIGTASNRNSQFPQPVGDANSLDAALASVGVARFLLDLRPLSAASPAGRWIAEPRTVQANLVSQLRMSVRNAFDAIFFVDSLTPARTALSP
jgi:erythromycin esterase